MSWKVSLRVHPERNGDVPWLKFGERDRTMAAVFRFEVAARRAEFTINVPPPADECVLLYPIPTWVTQAQLAKLMGDKAFVAALEAIRVEVPVSDCVQVMEALDLVERLLSTLKDMPNIGDEFMVPPSKEPILAKGYTGRVRVTDVSPYGSLVWVEKLDDRPEGDEFVNALINQSDLKPVRAPKVPKAPKVKPEPVLVDPVPVERVPHTYSLFGD